MAANIAIEVPHGIFLDSMEDIGKTCIVLGEDGVEVSKGSCGRLGTRYLQNTVLMPGLCNMHAHVMDSFMPEKLEDLSLQELVSHPGGAKFAELRRVNVEKLVDSVGEYLSSSLERGVVHIVSYIETTANGWQRILEIMGREEASLPLLSPRVQARVKDLGAYKQIVRLGLGLGLDTPLDFPEEEFRSLVREALSLGVGVQVHVSEDPHMYDLSDYEVVRGLKGLEAVHLTHASGETILELAASGVKPVFCPRSNALLVGKLPPLEVVEELYKQEYEYGWGTDNAAWVPPDVAGEALMAYLEAKGKARSTSKLARAILWGLFAPCNGKDAKTYVLAHVPLLDNSTDTPRSLVKRLATSTFLAIIHGGSILVFNSPLLNIQDNQLVHQGAFPQGSD